MDDNIGQKFNHLTILDIEYKKMSGHKRKYYICQCDCGNVVSIRADHILNNHTTSCGCYKKSLTSQLGKSKLKDLTGKTFGKLTVLYQDKYSNTNRVKWVCQCECGNQISVFGTNLVRLHTTSCGCSNRSIGEENIIKLLTKYNINYKKEYSFEDLRDKKKLRFDFAIFNKNNNLIELIEFDGRQHNNDYLPWNSDESLQERQYRDNLKNNYCKMNNIKLIRIPYSKRDNITLKDLEIDLNEYMGIQ